MDETDRIARLEARVAELTAMIERMTSGGARVTAAVPATPTVAAGSAATGPAVVPTTAEPPARPLSSRRGMLKLAGVAAVGAAAGAVARPGSAAAVDGDPVLIASTTTTTPTERKTTAVVYTNSAPPEVDGTLPGTKVAANIFVARDTSVGFPADAQNLSDFPAAVAGYSFRTVANGVYGFTANPGYGVVGSGVGTTSSGAFFRGERSNVHLLAAGAAAPARIDAHVAGELVCDESGDVWFCVADGTPGTWRKLAGEDTAGAFHPITPSRVYDSRAAAPSPGTIASGANRLVSVADQRNLATGAVTTANIVPPGATAVSCNLTVVNTVGSGYLVVNPGGTLDIGAAMINWYASNQILNNGIVVKLNPATRQVSVIANGGGSTHFVLDVTGYFR